MEFALHRPAAPLDGFVESITFFAGVMPLHQREKLIPDGAIQIIVDLTDTPKKLYAGETEPGHTDFRRFWISGMHLRPIVIEAQPLASMLIVRFRPGGAHALLRQPADALTGGVFPLDDVLGNAAASLRDCVLEAPTANGKFAAAERWLMEQAGGAAPDSLVRHLAARLQRPSGLRIRDLAEETGYSARHLQSLFRKQVGVTPKQYARINRFQQVLRAVARQTPSHDDLELRGPPLRARPDWAAIAAALGFADQSHLVGEFRSFSGMTPSAYAAAYRGLENYLPIFVPA